MISTNTTIAIRATSLFKCNRYGERRHASCRSPLSRTRVPHFAAVPTAVFLLPSRLSPPFPRVGVKTLGFGKKNFFSRFLRSGRIHPGAGRPTQPTKSATRLLRLHFIVVRTWMLLHLVNERPSSSVILSRLGFTARRGWTLNHLNGPYSLCDITAVETEKEFKKKIRSPVSIVISGKLLWNILGEGRVNVRQQGSQISEN